MKKLIVLLTVLFMFLPSIASAASMCEGMWTDHVRFQLTNPHDQNKCTCTSCHIGGFGAGSAGGGATCTSCHGGSRPSAKPKPTDHIQTSADCIVCHALKATFDGARMNHTGIVNGCAQCHTKPSSHPVVATPNCEACHQTTSWKCGG
jgi:hypothetical protein